MPGVAGRADRDSTWGVFTVARMYNIYNIYIERESLEKKGKRNASAPPVSP